MTEEELTGGPVPLSFAGGEGVTAGEAKGDDAGSGDGANLSVVIEEAKLDSFHEECGVFGVYGHPEAANLVYLGLYALQHRGQESAGIASSDCKKIHHVRKMGHVADIFTPDVLNHLPGQLAIGHTRYSTAGDTSLKNAQPLSVACSKGQVAVAHNGNLTNAIELRGELEEDGSIFQSTSDTEVILHLVAKSHERTLSGALREALLQIEG